MPGQGLDDLGAIPIQGGGLDDLGAIPINQPKTKSPGAMDYLKAAGRGLMDPFEGIGSGILHTGFGIADLADRAVGGKGIMDNPTIQKLTAPPDNPVGKFARTAEQVGEFMIPGGAEEAIASKAPAALKTAAKIAASAVGAGAVNKAQGGGFTTGAAAGGVGAGLGALAEKIAPSVAESALNISRKYRMYGKTPGKALLEETTGIAPGTISEQASQKALALTSQLENMASKSTAPASVAPAVQVVDDAIAKAQTENTPGIANQLSSIRDQLTHDLFATPPQQLPVQRSATDILNLKRGIGKMVRSWSVDERKGVQQILPQVYGALDSELDATVPGADQLNQRISSLIGVKTRGKATAEGASTAQRVMNRVGRATGALVGAGIGAEAGSRAGGTPGAIVGGLAGLVAPEILASPATQILGARALSKARLFAPAATGAALQLDREEKPSSLFAP